jgi:hypothetical protein
MNKNVPKRKLYLRLIGNGVILGVTTMVQFAVSLMIDKRYEPKNASC